MTTLFLILLGGVAITIWALYFESIMTWVFDKFPNHFSNQHPIGQKHPASLSKQQPSEPLTEPQSPVEVVWPSKAKAVTGQSIT